MIYTKLYTKQYVIYTKQYVINTKLYTKQIPNCIIICGLKYNTNELIYGTEKDLDLHTWKTNTWLQKVEAEGEEINLAIRTGISRYTLL